MNDSSVELVVFTCEGRAHLLQRTMQSFDSSVVGAFSRRRVLVDGPMPEGALHCVRPDTIIRHVTRNGYVRSIATALRHIDTEFFFWLEDDWHFEAPVDVGALVAKMRERPELVQIRLSKTGPLAPNEKRQPLGDGVYESTVGFSANPTLCRTAHVRAAFDAITSAHLGNTPGVDGWEEALSRWYAEHGLLCAVLDSPGVQHIGYLESTPRAWHMTASFQERPHTFVPGIGGSRPLWRRMWMMAKFGRRSASIALRMLHDDEAYEVAFRLVTLPAAQPRPNSGRAGSEAPRFASPQEGYDPLRQTSS